MLSPTCHKCLFSKFHPRSARFFWNCASRGFVLSIHEIINTLIRGRIFWEVVCFTGFVALGINCLCCSSWAHPDIFSQVCWSRVTVGAHSDSYQVEWCDTRRKAKSSLYPNSKYGSVIFQREQNLSWKVYVGQSWLRYNTGFCAYLWKIVIIHMHICRKPQAMACPREECWKKCMACASPAASQVSVGWFKKSKTLHLSIHHWPSALRLPRHSMFPLPFLSLSHVLCPYLQ